MSKPKHKPHLPSKPRLKPNQKIEPDPSLPRPAAHDPVLAAAGPAGIDPRVPGDFLEDLAAGYMPLLSNLLALRVPGDL